MVEPISVGLHSDTMAAGDQSTVNREDATRRAAYISDLEIVVRANEFGDVIPPAQRVVYSPQELKQLPTYVSSEQATEMSNSQHAQRRGHYRRVTREIWR